MFLFLYLYFAKVANRANIIYEINKNSRNHVVMESFKRLVTCLGCQLQYKARITQRTVPVRRILTDKSKYFFEKMRKILTAASKTRLQDSNIFISLGTKLPKRCLLPERFA